MKTIPLNTTSIGSEQKVTYAQLIEQCLSLTPKDGFKLTDMRLRLAILDKLANATTELVLEDAEAAKVRECVEVMPWAMLHKDIVTFTDTVLNACK